MTNHDRGGDADGLARCGAQVDPRPFLEAIEMQDVVTVRKTLHFPKCQGCLRAARVGVGDGSLG